MADENSVLDGLLEVFPEVDFSTLIEVSIQFKDDIDMAGDYIIQNVLPNILPDPHGHQQESNDTSTQIGRDPVDNSTISDSVQFDQTNNEKEGGPTAKQLKQSLTGLCPEVCDVPSTSGQSCTFEDFMFNRVSFQLDASSERNPISASGGDRPLHDDGSPDVNICSSYSVGLESVDNVIADEDCQLSSQRNPISASQGDGSLHDDGSPSSYSVNLESLDDVIASEHYKKNALMSNVAAISEMLQEVELNEENTKRAISEASQAGNDILVKVEELKELTTLAVEDNRKAEAEIFAEKSILATEAQELHTRLLSISEETKSFMLTIDAMHNTLQRRLADAEAERAAAEKSKLEREASAQKSLKEQELSLEAAKNHSKRLEQQAQENAKLRELLTDRGHAVDALHGEMLGIFDSIAQLKLRVDTQLPVDEQWQHVSSSLSSSVVDEPTQEVPLVLSSSIVEEPLQQVPPILSSSAVDEPMQQVSPILSGSAFDEQLQQVSSILSSSAFDESLLAFDEPLQLVSSRLSSSVRSARSDGTLTESLASKNSWSSAAESNVSLTDDERTAEVSVGDFALDDSWDLVDDQDTIESPANVLKSTPMLL